MGRTLSHREAREFYDDFGARQDSQAFYEDRATGLIIANAAFGEARSVFEFGCGTGRFAETLLEDHLPVDARYTGVDVSSTMIALANGRLDRFGPRVSLAQTDGRPELDQPVSTHDRFVSNFVFDLLDDHDAALVVMEAHRLLAPQGLLCLTSLTSEAGGVGGVTSRVWSALHAAAPKLVGGCRPIDVRALIDPNLWDVVFRDFVTPFGLPAEALIARRK